MLVESKVKYANFIDFKGINRLKQISQNDRLQSKAIVRKMKKQIGKLVMACEVTRSK